MNLFTFKLIRNGMRNTFSKTTLVVLILNPVTSFAADSTKILDEITFLTWEEYISEEVVDEFEAEYGAKVNFVYFDSDNSRDEILTTSDGYGYDLILSDSVNLPLYKTLDWITAFDITRAPNISNVKLPLLSNLDKRDNICTPYSWGTTGIAYRKDLVPEPITSWKQIFIPASDLKGRILMSTLSQEVVGMALKYLGYSMGSSNKQQLEEARQLLLAQAPFVAGYSAVAAVAAKSKLLSGKVSVVLTYNSDALMLQDINPQIEYVLPKEGGAIWADSICLSSRAKNPELAHHFINFINQPEQAAKNTLFIYAATPNLEAQKILPEEFLNNPIIYPDKDAVALSETYEVLPLRTIKKQNSIMNELIGTLR